LDFVYGACCDGILEEGDYLVLDNASVHSGFDCLDYFIDLLESFGVHLVFLPAYSPELNPCELIFGLIKNRIRSINRARMTLLERTIETIASIEIETIRSFYTHCLYPKFILPDLLNS